MVDNKSLIPEEENHPVYMTPGLILPGQHEKGQGVDRNIYRSPRTSWVEHIYER